jgi:hypothetical protein
MKMATASKFNPNEISFEEGIQRLHQAIEKYGLKRGKIVTSRDPVVEKLRNVLRVENVPKGFRKWQLPVYLEKPSQLYFTIAEPGAVAPAHSHDEGDGIRFMVSGSIQYEGKELTGGDWMFIPAGTKYSFKVGPLGAAMCYCYCCSCAGSLQLFDPAPFIA